MILSAIMLLLFFSCFMIVPFYDKLCDAFGMTRVTIFTPTEILPESSNLESSNPKSSNIDLSDNREIQLQLDWTKNGVVPISISHTPHKVNAIVGESYFTEFTVKNTSDKAMIIQAIPSVTPITATSFLHKTECFCFYEQRIEARETLTFPMVFFFNKRISDDIRLVTLSYTFYDITPKSMKSTL